MTECQICLEDKKPNDIVYHICCFHFSCEECDKKYTKCPYCRSEMGQIRMWMGWETYDIKNANKLRLLDRNYTDYEILRVLYKSFPYLEMQLTTPPIICKKRNDGKWSFQIDIDIESEGEYFIKYIRSPHIEIDKNTVDGWIVTLLMKSCPQGLTEQKIYEECNRFTNKLASKFLTQDYIHSRIENLTDREFCKTVDGNVRYLI